MISMPRQMRLTEELVARVHRKVEDPGIEAFPDIDWCTDADRDEAVVRILAGRPSTGDVWIFGYGSLIWKPGFESVERRIGVVNGWHRAFCLGWLRRFRGTREQPALMMALDHGGQCEGVAFRLPPGAVETNLRGLLQREMQLKRDPMLPIWEDIHTEAGMIRAITFVIDRDGEYYVGGLAPERIAEVLAVAAGHFGTMADYLYQTVRHLEEIGIHDEHLWHLQELVADRIEATTAGR